MTEGQEDHGWLAITALKVPKIQIFKFRKVKSSCVWGNDKCNSTFWKKNTISWLTPERNLSLPIIHSKDGLVFSFLAQEEMLCSVRPSISKFSKIRPHLQKLDKNSPTRHSEVAIEFDFLCTFHKVIHNYMYIKCLKFK